MSPMRTLVNLDVSELSRFTSCEQTATAMSRRIDVFCSGGSRIYQTRIASLLDMYVCYNSETAMLWYCGVVFARQLSCSFCALTRSYLP